MPLCDHFLPAELPAHRVSARVGLMSDTHMPTRRATIPATLFDALLGVDVLLHAGDVGDLWVLDGLSSIAPVIAVHGNDETEEAAVGLPSQYVLTAAGRRILLTHGHYPDRATEMASRAHDAWEPKLARRAAMGAAAHADIVVFGHTHIPMAREYDGVLLVNPGAVASANATTRQTQPSVALLFIRDDGAPFVVHVDLTSGAAFVPEVDWDAGFKTALDRVTAPILTPELAAEFPRLRERVQTLAPERGWAVYRQLAMRCWEGEQEMISSADLLDALRADDSLPTPVRDELTLTLAGVAA